MAIPTFLNTTHRYLRTNGVTDVGDIITDAYSELVTNGGWSDEGGGVMKSPVDSDSRWFDVNLSEVDADTLQIVVRDSLGATVATRRMDIDGAGTDIIISSGPMHLAIISLRATPEYLLASMIDMSPESQTVHLAYMVAGGTRNSSGTIDASGYSTYGLIKNLNSGAYTAAYFGEKQTTSAAATQMITVSGAYTFRPVFVHGTGPSNIIRQFGRMYQFMLGSSGLTSGSLYDVPIDTGVTAKFTRLGAAVDNTVLFVRAD